MHAEELALPDQPVHAASGLSSSEATEALPREQVVLDTSLRASAIRSGPEPSADRVLSDHTIPNSPFPEKNSENQELIPAIFRPATEEDLIQDRENRELARKAYFFCRECVAERGLDMKLVDVELLFDGSKMIFYFTAPNRIDFRELVKDLVRAYRTRIELRQIGARHETQMLGGLGNCGQLVCCQRFLRQFAPSTIKMAKEQNLFLNPAKISGVCNRLLCCLSYEQPNYDEFLNQCPKIGKRFSTSLGTAKVIRANYFRRTLSLYMEPGGEREVDLDEWRRMVSMPGEGGETDRRGTVPRSGRSEEAGPGPTHLRGKSVSAAPVMAKEPREHPVKDSQATADDGQASTEISTGRKRTKRSGRKGKPRTETAPSAETKVEPGNVSTEAHPLGGSASSPSGKAKRRSRSSRRKPKKQSGSAPDQH
ncbi:MAG: hypothetical protein EA399_04020 [Desulfovibrionales bacterium]|nr:MAG: hypothetical protein EA399_04020 [Desulfovibrionales bacterium]